MISNRCSSNVNLIIWSRNSFMCSLCQDISGNIEMRPPASTSGKGSSSLCLFPLPTPLSGSRSPEPCAGGCCAKPTGRRGQMMVCALSMVFQAAVLIKQANWATRMLFRWTESVLSACHRSSALPGAERAVLVGRQRSISDWRRSDYASRCGPWCHS